MSYGDIAVRTIQWCFSDSVRTMETESFTRLNPILVDNAKGAECFVIGMAVRLDGEGVKRLEPTVVACSFEKVQFPMVRKK